MASDIMLLYRDLRECRALAAETLRNQREQLAEYLALQEAHLRAQEDLAEARRRYRRLRRTVEIAAIVGLLVALLGLFYLPATCQAQRRLFAPEADGQAYPTALGAVGHAALKAGIAGGLDLGLRKVAKVGPTASWLLAAGGSLLLGKALELAKGNTLGPVDLVHDAAWTFAGPALVRGKAGALGVSLAVIVATCHRASPQPRICR